MSLSLQAQLAQQLDDRERQIAANDRWLARNPRAGADERNRVETMNATLESQCVPLRKALGQ